MKNSYIPREIKNYVKFGAFEDIRKIVEARVFLPVFITGLARSGKTAMTEQACFEAGRDLIRVNITEETDSDDLLGSFRLEKGNTVFFHGPVVVAMKLGAVLLLDEVDLASFKCMVLQPVLEGSPVYLKKTGETIYPEEGFNIIATANTKGQGDKTGGKFQGTQLLNEGFLDRFSITVEHTYPPSDIEKEILSFYIPSYKGNKLDEIFLSSLIDWALGIRKNYAEGTASDLVSTGRLIHIVRTYAIFKDPFKAVKLGVSRFDEYTQEVFIDMFGKIFPFSAEDLKGASKSSAAVFMRKAAEEMDLSELDKRRRKFTTQTKTIL